MKKNNMIKLLGIAFVVAIHHPKCSDEHAAIALRLG